MTINAQRPTPSDDAELRFLETPAGQPAAVKTWWYPGRTIGREFIYPRSQALRLARATNQTVLSTQAENVSNEQMQSAGLSRVSPSGEEEALSDAQLVDAAANTAPVGHGGSFARGARPGTGRRDGSHQAAEDEHAARRYRPDGADLASRRSVDSIPAVNWSMVDGQRSVVCRRKAIGPLTVDLPTLDHCLLTIAHAHARLLTSVARVGNYRHAIRLCAGHTHFFFGV